MNPARLAWLVAFAAPFAQGQRSIETPTREADAYNNWKLALNGATATDPATLSVPLGFKVELLRSATPEEDSWVAMAFDPQGRLTIAREKKGLLRFTLGTSAVEKVEVIDDTLLECRGLLYADGSLFANANNSKAFVRVSLSPDAGATATELLRTDGGVGH